jgi:hypothetical protein
VVYRPASTVFRHGSTMPSPAARPGEEEARMPDPSFSVHVERDDLVKLQLAAGLPRPAGAITDHPQEPAADAAHHGARDGRQAARERSGRDRSGRAAGAAGGRTYAFRRS